MGVSVGQQAPSFELADKSGAKINSDSLRGSKALVVFIPFPFTGVCEGELCTFRDELSDLEALGAKVVTITCDTRPANAKWAADHGYNFPILSDYWPHGATAQAYGCFNDTLGCANRATYVLDREGIVRAVITSEQLKIARSYEDTKAALEAF